MHTYSLIVFCFLLPVIQTLQNRLAIDKSIVEYVFDLQWYMLCSTWILRVQNTHTLCTVILVQDQVGFLLLSYCY